MSPPCTQSSIHPGHSCDAAGQHPTREGSSHHTPSQGSAARGPFNQTLVRWMLPGDQVPALPKAIRAQGGPAPGVRAVQPVGRSTAEGQPPAPHPVTRPLPRSTATTTAGGGADGQGARCLNTSQTAWQGLAPGSRELAPGSSSPPGDLQLLSQNLCQTGAPKGQSSALTLCTQEAQSNSVCKFLLFLPGEVVDCLREPGHTCTCSRPAVEGRFCPGDAAPRLCAHPGGLAISPNPGHPEGEDGATPRLDLRRLDSDSSGATSLL